MVEGAALEMLCTEMYLGFESLTLRQKSPKNQGFSGFSFLPLLLKIGSKLWKEQPVFWKEQGDFGHFGVFEP